MEPVVAVAIAILSVVVFASILGLAVVVRWKLCRKDEQQEGVELVEEIDGRVGAQLSDIELLEIGISESDIERIAENVQWVDDVSGWIPHCLAVLKTCHRLTEQLVSVTLACKVRPTGERLDDILRVAKTIAPRIDDIAKSMEPPLDPRLLEARCVALVLSVEHLVLVTKAGCGVGLKRLTWIDESLADLQQHLHVLRMAAAVQSDNFLNRSRPASRKNSVRVCMPRDKSPDVPTVMVTDTSNA